MKPAGTSTRWTSLCGMSAMLYTGHGRKEPGMGESIPREAEDYYNRGIEAGRLYRSHGLIEFARTQEIILRHLPSPPCTVLDVGGGPGAYACWLASLGYRVILVDAFPCTSSRPGPPRRASRMLRWPTVAWATRDTSTKPMRACGPCYCWARSIT